MRDRARVVFATFVILVSLACVARGAHAHVGHVIARAERYLKLDATESDTRVVVSLALGADEGERVMEEADTDDDGDVSQAEGDAYLAQWSAGLRDELPITIDGRRAEIEWRDGYLQNLGRVRRIAQTVEMVAHVPVDAREHVITIEDRMVRRDAFDRTDVAFRAHDGAELVTCGTEADPARCDDPELAFLRGPPVLERLVARVRYPNRRAPIPWLAVGGAAAAITVAAIAAFVRRRARTTRAS